MALSLQNQSVFPVDYVLRWAQGTTEHEKGELSSSHLSGYGISLDFNKMDYIVLDDRNQHQVHTTTQDPSDSIEIGVQHSSNEEILTCIFDSLPYTDGGTETSALKGEPLMSEEIRGSFYST